MFESPNYFLNQNWKQRDEVTGGHCDQLLWVNIAFVRNHFWRKKICKVSKLLVMHILEDCKPFTIVFPLQLIMQI